MAAWRSTKVAFAHREHRRITEYIMGPRFDEALFEEVHRYIDGKGGLGHREKHGHNEEAERFVQKKWGDIAVEIFNIHIFSDALYDSLGSAVKSIYDAHLSGMFPLPYFTVQLADKRPEFAVTTEEKVIGCKNCGSPDTVDPMRSWIGPPVCSECLELRNLEVCVQCKAFFCRHDRQPSPENPERYLCPVCVAKWK